MSDRHSFLCYHDNMKLVILPGNSASNKVWNEIMSDAFADMFPKRYAHSYAHWKSGKNIIDIDAEADALVSHVGTEEIVILGKSIGAVLAIKCVAKNYVHPKKCVLMGLPIEWAREHGMPPETWMDAFNVPTLFIQNDNDPVAPCSDTKYFLKRYASKQFSTVIIEGTDHKYNDVPAIKTAAGKFFLSTM